MSLELVKCPYCGFKFRTDIKAKEKDGETFFLRYLSFSSQPETRQIKTIDLECPNCKRTFEHEIKS